MDEPQDATAINVLLAELETRPTIAFERQGDTIFIPAATDDGFDICLTQHRSEITVTFGNGAHEHLTDEVDAVGLVGAGLNGDVRLRIHQRGAMEYRWIVEEHDDAGNWVTRNETCLLFFPYWKPKQIVHRQNSISLDRPKADF